MRMRFKKSAVLPECARCSGKGVAGESYSGRAPGYVSPTVEYGELTLTDDRGATLTVERDVTADAGRPYPERPAYSYSPSERAEATMERWKLTKAQQCAELLRPPLGTWQYAEDVKERTHAVGFKPNAVERARHLLRVEIENRDGRSFWRLPEPPDGAPTRAELEQMDGDGLTGVVDVYGLGANLPAEEFASIDALRDWVAAQLNLRKSALASDIRTFDDTAAPEVGSSEAAADKRPPEHEALENVRRLRRAKAGSSA